MVAAVIDIDHFKTINDRDGHDAGDAIIIATGKRLRTLVRRTDIVARIGGDEFVVISFLDEPAGLSSSAERLTHLHESARVTYSIGIAAHTPTAQPVSLQTVLEQADTAMYRAKDRGGNQIHTRSADL